MALSILSQFLLMINFDTLRELSKWWFITSWEMPIHPICSSSDIHSWTSLRQRGLSDVREKTSWQPMDTLPELTLESRFSSWERIRAAMVGHWRARQTARVEWNLESLRILLPISLWNDSREARLASVRIQFSQPYNKTGMTHVS